MEEWGVGGNGRTCLEHRAQPQERLIRQALPRRRRLRPAGCREGVWLLAAFAKGWLQRSWRAARRHRCRRARMREARGRGGVQGSSATTIDESRREGAGRRGRGHWKRTRAVTCAWWHLIRYLGGIVHFLLPSLPIQLPRSLQHAATENRPSQQ